jgi:hypothetical protein
VEEELTETAMGRWRYEVDLCRQGSELEVDDNALYIGMTRT